MRLACVLCAFGCLQNRGETEQIEAELSRQTLPLFFQYWYRLCSLSSMQYTSLSIYKTLEKKMRWLLWTLQNEIPSVEKPHQVSLSI